MSIRSQEVLLSLLEGYGLQTGEYLTAGNIYYVDSGRPASPMLPLTAAVGIPLLQRRLSLSVNARLLTAMSFTLPPTMPRR